MTQVVLIRPWADARAGGGCCSGEVREHLAHDVVGETYRALRAARPDLDVQVVGAGNTLWLAPTVFRSARRRGSAVATAALAAARANRPGAVMVDGVTIGHLDDLGANGVVAAVSDHARHHLTRSEAPHPAPGERGGSPLPRG